MSRKRKPKRPKPRAETTYATTAGEVEEISLFLDPQTAQVHFGSAMVNTYSETSYDRLKGPKVLTRTPISGPGLQIDPNDAVIRNYDLLVAVDTNTRQIAEQLVSVTGIIVGTHAQHPSGGTAVAYRTPFCLEFVDVVAQPERVGWMMAIRELRDHNVIPGDARVGLIVDSDLSNLPSYNARRITLYGDFFLPERVQLIYASSDAGRGYLANKLIQMADRAAHQVLDYLAAGKAPLNRRVLEGFPFKGYRRIVGR